MSLGSEFSLPDGEGEGEGDTTAAAVSPAQARAPVIVIEYRNRGLATRLMPPALILCAALAIASYQRKTPVWPLMPRPQTTAVVSPPPQPPANPENESKPVALVSAETPPVPTAPEPAPTPTPAPAPTPAPDVPAVSPQPTTAKVETPDTRRPASPFDLETVDGLQPVEPTSPKAATTEPVPTPPDRIREPRPASDDLLPEAPPIASVAANPAPAAMLPPVENNPTAAPSDDMPEPSKDEILRDIEREAEQKDAKRQDLEGLKSNARMLLLNEALTKVNNDRTLFRDELKRLLAQLGDRAGEDIGLLCERYGKEAMPEVKSAYARFVRTAPKRMSRPAKVERMRVMGVPEPLILDQICKEFDTMMNTRGGPRTEDEVRVRAARALLAVPVTPIGRKPAAQPSVTASP